MKERVKEINDKLVALEQEENELGVELKKKMMVIPNIIDDSVKIAYASNFNVVPDDKTVDKEFKKMKLGDLSTLETQMAKNALPAEIAWQIVVARTILPTVDVTDEDINTIMEKKELSGKVYDEWEKPESYKFRLQ